MTNHGGTRDTLRTHKFHNDRKWRYFKMHRNDLKLKMAARRKRKPSTLVA